MQGKNLCQDCQKELDERNGKIASMEQGHKYHSDAVHKSRDKIAQEQQGIKVSLSIPETQTCIKNALSEWTLEMLALEDLVYMGAEPVDNGGRGHHQHTVHVAHWEPIKCVVTYFASQNNIDELLPQRLVLVLQLWLQNAVSNLWIQAQQAHPFCEQGAGNYLLEFLATGERVNGKVEYVKDNLLKMAKKCPHVPWMSIAGLDRKPWCDCLTLLDIVEVVK
ncbi:hypothetical protein BC830DRAFT_1215697 [Chytriomyces sp. MP71]|nr:hypothetical protein BC830DRAFT_1215697 [Chytriomyces sp. MP71]